LLLIDYQGIEKKSFFLRTVW